LITESAKDLKQNENDKNANEDTIKSSGNPKEENIYQKNYCLIQYIEYLFLIHRKISLLHMNYAIEKKLIVTNKDLVEKSFILSLKHVNEALTFLNYQKEFQNGQIIEFRQASIYFLLGKCHSHLKNVEMELEMFANSLDLYENIIPQDSYDTETCIHDKILSINSTKSRINCNELFDSFRYDYDDETKINYIKRINQLYQYIENALIKMEKLKEALLVTERHRTKTCSSLNNLPDLTNFEQIQSLVSQKSISALIYFSQVEVSSTLNCWLLKPNSDDIASFKQIPFSAFDNLFVSKKFQNKADFSIFIDEVINSSEENQNRLLCEAYNILIKPFESLLSDVNSTNSASKPLVYIVYDEKMFKMPFHLFKSSQNDQFLFDLYEIDCIYSLKYLFRNKTYIQKYTKNQPDSSFTMPMRVISNEDDMEKLLLNSATTSNTKNNNYHYDLLLLLVNSEHKGYFLSH
jgi:hypothetical protein